MRVQAWAPGHATLIFAAPGTNDDPQLQGSLGLGLNFNTGVLTTVEEADQDKVYWNSKEISGEVTKTTLERYRELTGQKENFAVHHYSELKIGYGLSTSGAGSIGAALAVDRICQANLEQQELFRIAHYADIINHTGLGSVMGQITGGIEHRTKIGGPGTGETISFDDDAQIILLMMGKLQTSDVLVSPKQMDLVNRTGQELLDQLKGNKLSLSEYLNLGKTFTKKCGLMTDLVEKRFDQLQKIGEDRTSMAMIGETILVYPRDPSKVVEFAHKYRIDTAVTKISSVKPRVIDIHQEV